MLAEYQKNYIIDNLKQKFKVQKKPQANLASLINNFEYDKKLTALENRVAITKLEKYHEGSVDGIIIPATIHVGSNLNSGIVMSVGKKAAECNIKEGDKVLYDHFSVFYDTHPVVITNIENVICKYDETDGKFESMPIGNYVAATVSELSLNNNSNNDIVIPDKYKDAHKFIFQITKLGTGKKNCPFEVSVGDYILVGGEAMKDISVSIKMQKVKFINCDNILAVLK